MARIKHYSKFGYGDRVQHVMNPKAQGIITEVRFRDELVEYMVTWSNNGENDRRAEIELEPLFDEQQKSVGFKKNILDSTLENIL